MEDISKLTIPKLKALCKEKRLSGYSKLNKPGLIAKLLEHQGLAYGTGGSGIVNEAAALPLSTNAIAAETVARSTSASTQMPTADPIAPPRETISTRGISSQPTPEKSTPKSRTKKPERDVGPSRAHTSRSITVPNQQSPPVSHPLIAAPESSLAPFLSLPAQAELVPSSAPRLSKRKGIVPTEAPTAKKLKPTTKAALENSPVRVNTTSKLAVLVPVPRLELPVTKDGTVEPDSAPEVAKDSVKRQAVVGPVALQAKKKGFAPLVPRLPPLAAKVSPANNTHAAPTFKLSVSSSSSWVSNTSFEFKTDDVPIVLRSAALPPLISQRKKVQRLSMVFSLLFEEDLSMLSRLSRLYRYSAYISASHILMRDFAGLRLDGMFRQYSPKMIDYWPYLRKRRAEVNARKQDFGKSFLGKQLAPFPSIISPRLWACDNSKGLLVAAKFLLTSFFYKVSIGLVVPFDSMSILSAEEVVSGEIWKVTARQGSATQFYYVLEATCEVVGLPSLTGTNIETAGNPSRRSTMVRADWTAYIESKLRAENPCQWMLQDHLAWPNHEEYDHGISKNWINRVKVEWKVGLVKLLIARRYVLACLVANSLSGKHMTSVEMEQEFNGRPGDGTLHTRKARQRQNLSLFLPSHHLVESVHITSRGNVPLHPAVASVQTPGREYYILRDNGLQIGTEEDGICDAWMSILHCTSDGVVL